ncbi:MAG: hypothetical protein KF866_00015 [Phycisphaeraceae bacterium]|nr:hypothetical protein [Phycisphaeraceae bacterium]
MTGSASADVFFDFSASGHGFTSAGSPSWVWGGAYPAPGGVAWSTPGGISTANTLTSPVLTVTTAGFITGSFTHRYNFEDRFDSGVIKFQRNDEGIHVIPASLMPMNPPTGSADRFTGTSPGWIDPGYITTTFTLGAAVFGPALFEVGDRVIFQFNAGWDHVTTWDAPNWQIGSLRLSNVVPSPGGAALLGLAGVLAGRRRR